MLSSAQLKQITAEARPVIERMLDDADVLAGMRDLVAAGGGDWSALKALIKAEIKDARDEAGDGKHVRKILEKAGYSTAYADMLGLGNLNEENFSDSGINESEPDHASGMTPSLAGAEADADRQPIHVPEPVL